MYFKGLFEELIFGGKLFTALRNTTFQYSKLKLLWPPWQVVKLLGNLNCSESHQLGCLVIVTLFSCLLLLLVNMALNLYSFLDIIILDSANERLKESLAGVNYK